MSHQPNAELDLAAACCSWPPTTAGDDTVRALAQRIEDWARFDAVVRRNRITPLVRHALSRVEADLPERLVQDLATRGGAAARNALLLARETLRVQQAFDAEGVPVMALKGAALAMLAYGDLAMKESRDVDILVRPGDAVRAQKLLAELGYTVELAGLQPAQFGRYVAHAMEASFVHRSSGLIVDLHWRLAEHDALLRGIDADGPDQRVPLPGGSLRTLEDGALFAFLCVHGATHNWSRLKWLADLNAFLRRRDEAEVARLYEAADAMGAGRCAAVALGLCTSLLGLPLGADIRGKIAADGAARFLQANALAGLRYGGGSAEHVAYTAPWLRTMAGQFVLAPGASYALGQARQLWNSPTDRARFALPRPFGFAYHLLRIPLWLARLGHPPTGTSAQARPPL